jgi:hypothetical protein
MSASHSAAAGWRELAVVIELPDWRPHTSNAGRAVPGTTPIVWVMTDPSPELSSAGRTSFTAPRTVSSGGNGVGRSHEFEPRLTLPIGTAASPASSGGGLLDGEVVVRGGLVQQRRQPFIRDMRRCPPRRIDRRTAGLAFRATTVFVIVVRVRCAEVPAPTGHPPVVSSPPSHPSDTGPRCSHLLGLVLTLRRRTVPPGSAAVENGCQ